MASGTHSDSAVRTGRLLSASPGQIFATFRQPELLAQWWGPNGFTNTFEQFEFKIGGRWNFVMHGPNGVDYRNESLFLEIEPDTRLVIEHIVQPWFRLTVTLVARGGQTQLNWVQEFESPKVAHSLRALCATANEQVLDRLQALLVQ